MSNVNLSGYGSGNVASVSFALERLGARVRISADPADLDEAERVILPGVGAAGYAMQRLNALGLVEPFIASCPFGSKCGNDFSLSLVPGCAGCVMIPFCFP